MLLLRARLICVLSHLYLQVVFEDVWHCDSRQIPDRIYIETLHLRGNLEPHTWKITLYVNFHFVSYCLDLSS